MKKLILIISLIITFLLSCKKNKEIQHDLFFQSVYDTIRSCPGGGGLFIVSLIDSVSLEGQVSLILDASPDLNASFTRTEISKESPVAEIIINPKETAQIKDYQIKVTANNLQKSAYLYLTVQMFNWSNEIGEGPLLKKDEFDNWMDNEFPAFNISPDMEWGFYPTYPEILVVEHYTFLNEEYEYRICKHAMIPPYDWTMIRLRKRNEAEPFFAAKQDSTGGLIYQIPVANYPLLLGY